MTSEQKEQIAKLRLRQKDFESGYYAYKEIEREIENVFALCRHEDFRKARDDDEYEGRSYWRCICNDCGHDWYERVIVGR